MMKPSLAALLVDIDRIGPLAIARIERLQNINAELLEALEAAEPWLMRLTSEVIDGEGIRTEYAEICAKARAAIKRAKIED